MRQILVIVFALASAAVGFAGGAIADDFPAPYNSEPSPESPLDPRQAAARFQVPAGFHVQVFAAEPDVQNPVALAWDHRGRMWVAENYTYAESGRGFDLALRDRVLILHDADGDGRAESRRVFTDQAQRLASVEVGLGGAWLLCPPQLLFVPDRDGDDVPDGPPEVVLDGFHIPRENHHTFANGLRWGPDGWLYGRCGASSMGRVRRPDQPERDAVPINGGVWRYHPTWRQFEVVAHGTTNPWGLDWNEVGEAFFVNTVNGHLWHLIAGGHNRRPHTISPNPLVYEPLEMCADHWHWDHGQPWTASRTATGEHDLRGGGHAHCGAMIYQADQWPPEYCGRLLTLNLHGRRVNVERLERSRSGYVAKHEPDMLKSADPFFRGLELSCGPDGAVYVLDWSDTGECHEHNGVHRLSGRIFRVSHGGDSGPSGPAPGVAVDLSAATLDALVAMQRHANEWFVRASRRELADRAARQSLAAATIEGQLAEIVRSDEPTPIRLRALWTWHTLRGIRGKPAWSTDSERLIRDLLRDRDEHLRTWGVRLLLDERPLDTVVSQPRQAASDEALPAILSELAERAGDESALVRLAVASALQRIPTGRRAELARSLVVRHEDADDPNLPKLIWYGLMPLGGDELRALPELAVASRLPELRRWVARRCAELVDESPCLDELLERAMSAAPEVGHSVALGLQEGLAGRHKVATPAHWAAFARRVQQDKSATEDIQGAIRFLGVVFGDGRALDEVRALALDENAELPRRRAALESLIAARPADLRDVLQRLLGVRYLNTTALAGLALFDDPVIGVQLARSYRSFHPSERPAVIEALVTRASFATALLDEMERGRVPRGDLSAVQARQLRGLGDPELVERLNRAWGELRDTPQDKQQLIERLRAQLTETAVAAADRSAGRRLFDKSCATCHRLFGSGKEIAPDLTGADRHNLDYLLSNIVDPSAVLNRDYQVTQFELADGRKIEGLLVSETPATVTIQTVQSRVAVLRSEVTRRARSTVSLMPDGLLQTLDDTQIRDLIAYLMGDIQVAP